MPLSVLRAPLDFPRMQYYPLRHEHCHYSDEARWLRGLASEATRSLSEAAPPHDDKLKDRPWEN